MFVKRGGSRSGRGNESSRGHVIDETHKLFKKYSGGDDQMDAAELAESLNDILGKGIQLRYRLSCTLFRV